jgi:hypothetical protein
MRTARTLEEEWRQVLPLSVNTGAKEDEPSTGRVWAAGFHLVNSRSRLAGVLKLTNLYFFNFPIFFSGRVEPWITETADTESMDRGAHLYFKWHTVFFFNIFRTKALKSDEGDYKLIGCSFMVPNTYYFINSFCEN